MTISVLVTGRLIADPERRTGQSGKPFTLARIVAQTDDGEAVVSLIAFGTTSEQLAAMGKGDTVSVTGRAKVNTWTGKDGASRAGLSVIADALLTPYHLRRKRAAAAVGGDRQPERGDDLGEGHDEWLDARAP